MPDVDTSNPEIQIIDELLHRVHAETPNKGMSTSRVDRRSEETTTGVHRLYT